MNKNRKNKKIEKKEAIKIDKELNNIFCFQDNQIFHHS
jgi:hypothetical protein